MTSQELAMVEIMVAASKLIGIEIQGIYTATPFALELVVLTKSAINYVTLHEAIQGLGLTPFVKQEAQLPDGKYGLRLMIYVSPEWQPQS